MTHYAKCPACKRLYKIDNPHQRILCPCSMVAKIDPTKRVKPGMYAELEQPTQCQIVSVL